MYESIVDSINKAVEGSGSGKSGTSVSLFWVLLVLIILVGGGFGIYFLAK